MDMYDDMADKGRKGDTYVGHLTGGEMVVPVAVLDAEDGFLRKAINGAMKEMDVNPDQFTVGHEANSVNPETGQIEFGLRNFVRRITNAVGITKEKPKGPSAAELKAIEDSKKRIAEQQAQLNQRETNLAKEKQSALRARRGRGGVYSLLGSEDRLG